jgi:hypothetical protein
VYRLNLSIKDSETKLRDEINKKSGKSAWIKDILSAYINGDLVWKDKTDKNNYTDVFNVFEN